MKKIISTLLIISIFSQAFLNAAGYLAPLGALESGVFTHSENKDQLNVITSLIQGKPNLTPLKPPDIEDLQERYTKYTSIISDIRLSHEKEIFILYGQLDSVFKLCSMVAHEYRPYSEPIIYSDIVRLLSNIETEFKSEKNNAYKQYKILLDNKHGLIGITDVPEHLNKVIKKVMDSFDEPLVVDAAVFYIIANLYLDGYVKQPTFIETVVKQGRLLCSYADFNGIMTTLYHNEKTINALPQDSREYNDKSYEFHHQQQDIHAILDQLPFDVLCQYFKKHLLDTKPDEYILFFLSQNFLQEKFLNILWEIYLDDNNTSDENNYFLSLTAQIFNDNIIVYCEKILTKMETSFREKDPNKTHKALQILLRLKIPQKKADWLFCLLSDAQYKKEILAAYCLIHSCLFGVTEYSVYIPQDSQLAPVTDVLKPESWNIYYYLLKIEEARRRGGAVLGDAVRRILYFSTGLDGFAPLPGRKGVSWFTYLRRRLHRNITADDLKVVRTVLYFIKSLDKSIIKDSPDYLIADADEDFGEEQTKIYSLIINRMLQKLSSSNCITSIEKDVWLDEILTIDEEEVLSALKEANTDAEKEDLEKMEFFIGLYFALSERSSLVGSKVIKNIKGERESYRDIIPSHDFMKKEYDNLLSVIDTDNHAAIFKVLTECRRALRKHLLFSKTEIGGDQNKSYFMKLDYNMFLLAKEKMGLILPSIEKCETMLELKNHIPSLISMAQCMFASGLGGVEFEQFIDELDKGSLTYSQLYDLIRSLQIEVHKINRKINETMRFSMSHIWENTEFDKLSDEWQNKIKTEQKKVPHGDWTETVITDDGKRETENEIIDNLIRDTGILIFEHALIKYYEILGNLTVDEGKSLIQEQKQEDTILDEQFFRFGQPEVIPREKLLSLWSKKGLNLVRMTEEDIPVPAGVIASAKLMIRPDIFTSDTFKQKIKKEIELLRKGSLYPDIKLLLYARSGSAFTLPGLLVTIPNLGMNDKEALDLAQKTGDTWFAYDTYAEFLRAYAIHILGIPEEHFQNAFNIYTKDTLTGEEMKEVCERYKEIVKKFGKEQKIPEHIVDQVMYAVNVVYSSWDSDEAREYRSRHKISQEWGTVVILQKGVFGNLNPTPDGRISGAGWGALRMLPDGREVIQGKFRYRSMGDQVMSRADRNYVLLSISEKSKQEEQTLEELEPAIYHKVLSYAHRLKEIFGNYQHFEFTIQLGDVWFNQTNDDVIRDDYPEFEDLPDHTPIAKGHGVSGGALRGWAANSFEAAEKLLEKYEKEKPQGVDGVILFLDRVNPDMINRLPKDVNIVANVLSVHAETLAQNYGITAVYGIPNMEYRTGEGIWYVGGKPMHDGTVISIDGHENRLLYHKSGNIYEGSLPLALKTDARALAEEISPRTEKKLRDLKDAEQWAAAMDKKSLALTPFEKEIIVLFEKVLNNKAQEGDTARYLVNYRIILDKIARLCENLNFKLHGDEFKETFIQKLTTWGITYNVFIELFKQYNPRGRKHQNTLNNVINRINYKPPENPLPSEVTIYDKKGDAWVVTDRELFDKHTMPKPYGIIHKPKQNIKLVSFEFSGVIGTFGSLSEIREFFKKLKSMGLSTAITDRDSYVYVWYENFKEKYPDISDYIDYVNVDYNPYLERYAEELNLKPEEIMHFGISWFGVIGIDDSFLSQMHKQGFISVLVPSMETFLYDVLEKKIDAVIFDRINSSIILDLLKVFTFGKSPSSDRAAPEKKADNKTQRQIDTSP